jgi:hypothetical protein
VQSECFAVAVTDIFFCTFHCTSCVAVLLYVSLYVVCRGTFVRFTARHVSRYFCTFHCTSCVEVLLYVSLYVMCRGTFPVVTYEAVALNFRSGNLAQMYKKLYGMSLRESREETTSAVVSRLLDILSSAQSVLSTQQEVTR